jgi:hypothetical protein
MSRAQLNPCDISRKLRIGLLTKANVAGCSRPDDLRRADISIKFATTADIVADVLSR